MTERNTNTEELAASLHRTILGTLLGILLIFGIGFGRAGFGDGNYLYGILGVAVALIAGYWILDLFREGAS